MNRRRFLYTTSAVAGGLLVPVHFTHSKARRISPNEKLNIAAVGAGGQAVTDINGCAAENIVALCDVDQKRLEERAAKFPKAKLFRDYRKMITEMKEIDGVVVSTPDHHHAHAAALAMRMGKHVYCQKPLTHSIWEARLLRKLAAKT